MPKRILWLLVCLVAAGPAWAADGVVLINQARALAGGVTPGDTPGFPVTLSVAGRYRLTGILTAPNQNTNMIEITANNVILDFNGFSIIGTAVCSVDINDRITGCTNAGTGIGVFSAANFLISLQGPGLVQGMGNAGIQMGAGEGFVLRDISVVSCNGNGIHLGDGAFLYDSNAAFNGGTGITVGEAGVLRRVTGSSNGGHGLSGNDGTSVLDGVFSANLDNGIFLENGARVIDVRANGNAVHGIQVQLVSIVKGCQATFNDNTGLVFFPATGTTRSPYSDCQVAGNGTATVTGTESLDNGGNVCGATAGCP
jgi:hypothetical protein